MPEVGRLKMVQAPRSESGSFNGRPWVMEGSPVDEEAPKDPAARQPASGHELTEQEISSNRHLYVGFHLPGKSRHGNSRAGSGQHNHGHKHGHHKNKNHLKTPQENLRPDEEETLLSSPGKLHVERPGYKYAFL